METTTRPGLGARIKGRVAVVSGAVTAIVLGMFVMASGSFASTTGGSTVDDGFTQLNSKITTYGGSIVALVVLAAGIFIGVKYLKKGLSKA